MWLDANLPPPPKERRTIGAKKLMISVMWTTSGMKSIVMLQRGEKFTRTFFVDVILADYSRQLNMKDQSKMLPD